MLRKIFFRSKLPKKLNKNSECDKEPCQTITGMTNVSSDYKGSRSYTRTGKSCVHWHSARKYGNLPGMNHNHCRNPDNDSRGVWCYTSTGYDWEFCDVPGLFNDLTYHFNWYYQ